MTHFRFAGAGFRLGALAVIAALTGCAGTGGAPALAMMDGAVIAQGPQGYCVDRGASSPATGFAVLGGCALISELALMPQTAGIITLQFGPEGSASVEGAERDLVALLRAPEGAALLSASGDPASVALDGVETGPGIVMVRFSDTAPALVAGLETAEWRAFLDVSGRLTTISLRGFAHSPIARGAALQVMAETVQALRAANPGT